MPTSAGLLTDRDIKDQLAITDKTQADLQVEDWSEPSVTPVGYDVRAGNQVFTMKDKKWLELGAKGAALEPGDTFFIPSCESFILSRRVGGLTLSRLNPLLDGLQMTPLTVDPGWKGNLLIVLTNQGPKPVVIRAKDRLMTLCLFSVCTPAETPVERHRVNNDDIYKKLDELERAAASEQWKRGLKDGTFVLLALALYGALHVLTFIANRSEVIMFTVATAAIWFSITRGKA